MSSGGWRCRLFSDGFCRQLEAFAIRKGRLRRIQFPSLMALLEHSKHGAVLFDTGYTERFFSATGSFPYRLYRWITPVRFDPAMTAVSVLKREGIPPQRLKHVILSHFHADHMGGLLDFPEASVFCTKAGFDSVKDRKGFRAVRHAYLPDLLPEDFSGRARFLEDLKEAKLDSIWAPFSHGRDLFGDGSLLAIDLPGHATGQFGLAFYDGSENPVFLVADACWVSDAYRENKPPQWLGWFPQADSAAYRKTLEKLQQLHLGSPKVRIVPTHCAEIGSDILVEGEEKK